MTSEDRDPTSKNRGKASADRRPASNVGRGLASKDRSSDERNPKKNVDKAHCSEGSGSGQTSEAHREQVQTLKTKTEA